MATFLEEKLKYIEALDAEIIKQKTDIKELLNKAYLIIKAANELNIQYPKDGSLSDWAKSCIEFDYDEVDDEDVSAEETVVRDLYEYANQIEFIFKNREKYE
jgi:hypothetical protein